MSKVEFSKFYNSCIAVRCMYNGHNTQNAFTLIWCNYKSSSTCFHTVDVSQITDDCWMYLLFQLPLDLMVHFIPYNFSLRECVCVCVNTHKNTQNYLKSLNVVVCIIYVSVFGLVNLQYNNYLQLVLTRNSSHQQLLLITEMIILYTA